MNRRLLALVLAVALGGCDRIQSMLVERGAARGLAGDRTDLLEDGKLHVILCGTGSPLPDPERMGPCTAVIAGGHFFQIDAGPGSSRNVGLWRLPRARLEGLLLTHYHSDHMGEVGEQTTQTWIAGRKTPLAIYGPEGVEQVVAGFRQAYALDVGYRVLHHGVEAMPESGGETVAHTLTLPAPEGAVTVFEGDGLKITAFAVDHTPVTPAFGYRVDFNGRSVVISGDTKKSDNLVRHSKGADVLITEGIATNIVGVASEYARTHDMGRMAKLTSDVVNYHTSPKDAALEAKEAGVKMLVFTHIVPPLNNFIARRMFLDGVQDAWNGQVVVGKDGMQLTLPPNSTEINVDQIN